MSKIFTFHRVGTSNSRSCWLCLINNGRALQEALFNISLKIPDIYMAVRKSNPDVIRHAGTQEASMMKTLLSLEIKRKGIKEMPMNECLIFMEKIKTQALKNIYSEEGQVYIGRNGGVRPSVVLPSDEEIFETYVSDKFIFPVMSDRQVDVKKWCGGSHFYLMVDGGSVEFKGKAKYNTIEAAEEAKKQYLKKYRFK